MVLLKNTHLLCCAANRTAQRMFKIRFAMRFLRALHLSIFERPIICRLDIIFDLKPE